MGWKAISRCAIGTSHQSKGTTCQDFGKYLIDNDVIIGAVSDGMGSAKHSDIGAQLTVETILSWLKEQIARRQTKQSSLQEGITEKEAITLFQASLSQVIARLSDEVVTNEYALQDLACTLLAFVATPNWIMAMQIGDGFIVVKQDNQEYQILFEADKGEYANITTSVTSKDARDKMKVKVLSGKQNFICASTDGLETVAIDRRKWIAANIFFEPLEEYMQITKKPEEEDQYIVQFLNSDRLNENTNDDKTLLVCLFEEKEESPPSPKPRYGHLYVLGRSLCFNILAGCFLYFLCWNYSYKNRTLIPLSIILIINIIISFLMTLNQLKPFYKIKQSLTVSIAIFAMGMILGYLTVYILK